jgi:hypothetical protein
MNIQHF